MGAPKVSPQTGVYADLFSTLDRVGVLYCDLKGTDKLSETLQGRGDLDLLILPADLADTGRALLELGFKPAHSLVGPPAPAQWHYFRPRVDGGWDHAHLHSAVVFSEQLRTSHLVSSMTEPYLAHSHHVGGIRLPEPGGEYAHLILKVFNRFSSFPDLVLLATGRWDPWPEIAAVRSRAAIGEAIQVLGEAKIELSPGVLERCDRALALGRLSARAILLGWLVRRRLAPSRISSWPRRLRDYLSIGFERVRRKLSGRTTRVSRYGGLVVAVVGPDAVGKSTLVAGLAARFASVYRVRVLHGGKPAPTWQTIPLRIARNLWRLVRRDSDPSTGGSYDEPRVADPAQRSLEPRVAGRVSSSDERTSLAQALNAWAVAMDRRSVLAKANREAARGSLVLLDRYPSQVRGGMDGPRLASLADAGGVRGWLSKKEGQVYAGFIPPDLVIRLTAPMAELVARDGTRMRPDGASYLRFRASPEVGWGMDRECRLLDLTTTVAPDEVQERAVAEIWKIF